MSHVESLIPRVLTGELLAPKDDEAFRAHLRSCEACRQKYDEALTVLRLARGDVRSVAPGEVQRLTARAAWLAKPPAPRRAFDWRFAFVGAALATAAVLTLLLWPRTPVGTVLVAGKGLMLDGVLVGKDAVIYEDTVITTEREDAAILLSSAKGRRGLLLRPNTKLRASTADDVTLQTGRVRVQSAKPGAPFVVRAADGRVVQSAPGTFAVETKPTGALVAVHQGTVNVTAAGGAVEVKDGFESELANGTPSTPKVASATALIEDRGDGSVWDAILRFLKQLVDAIARALAGD